MPMEKVTMRWKTTPLPAALLFAVAMALAILAILPGCGGESSGEGGTGGAEEPQRVISLQTLAQGSVCEYGRFESPATGGETGPAFLVIGDQEEFRRLLFLSGLELDPGQVDFTRQVVMAAFQGPRNTAGYAISIVHATQAGAEVRVEVEMVEPEPGGVTAQILTSPYHLVLARRDDFQPRGELSFTFVDTSGKSLERLAADI